MCRIHGHTWSPWRWEADEDGTRPSPDMVLLWTRRCEFNCGTIQSCHARYDQKGELPS